MNSSDSRVLGRSCGGRGEPAEGIRRDARLFRSLRTRGVYPGWFAAWPDKEGAARRLRSFSLVVIDGLLQAPDYARAILRTRVGATAEELDKAVSLRMDRQRILAREDPPELWAIIDEGTLRRPVGSPEIMPRPCRGRRP